MRLFLLVSFLFSFKSFACECAGGPLSGESAMKEYMELNYRVYHQLTDEDIHWIAYHPTLGERLAAHSHHNTNCYEEGPRGEPMFACVTSRKSDYEITLREQRCNVVLRTKTTETSIHVMELSSTCKKRWRKK